jgi:hypothetical protein
MYLIQVLLPVTTAEGPVGEALLIRTRDELVAAYGGVTAYLHTPAQGVWTGPSGGRDYDQMVLVEVLTPRLERPWWRSYAVTLAQRFQQDVIHVRATRTEILTEEL